MCAAGIWQLPLSHYGEHRAFKSLIPLGLAKLFTDQAVPSAGLSGTLLVARALKRRGISRDFEMAIAGDRVDAEYVVHTRRWDNRFIRRFMVIFGLLSSLFDYLTFGLLLLIRVSYEQFRAGWFVESVVSAVFIVLVIRTRRPFFRSKPAVPLLSATLLIACIALFLPLSPFAGILGFKPPPIVIFTAICGIVLLYILAAERVKGYFYRKASPFFQGISFP